MAPRKPLPFNCTLIILLIAHTSAMNNSLPCSSTHSYTVRFLYQWNAQEDPAFPIESSVAPGFTSLICASHNADYTMWKNNEHPSDAIYSLMNQQNSTLLIAELEQNMAPRNKTVFQFQNSTETISAGDSEVSFNLTLNGNQNFTLISCISKIVPSPDFFVGISSEQFCDNGQFRPQLNLVLTGWDAGTDDAKMYEDDPIPNSPSETNPITVLLGLAEKYGVTNITSNTGASTTPAPEPSTSACFPAHETVQLDDGTHIPIHHLSTDHFVKTHAHRFSRVYMFSHRDPKALTPMLKFLFTGSSTDNSLTISHGHYIYRFAHPASSQIELIPAYRILLGDDLVDAHGRRITVTNITTVLTKGLYNPHTLSGDLLVSGIRVSCYTTAVPPAVASIALSPFRVLHRIGLAAMTEALADSLLAGHWNHWLSRLVSVMH